MALVVSKNFFDHEREKTSKEGRGAVLGGLKQSVKKNKLLGGWVL